MWGRTAVDVLLSDCQHHKGTALCGQCGVWNTIEMSENMFFKIFLKTDFMQKLKTLQSFS